MAEKRIFRRARKRLLVDFETALFKTTGFTHDVSRSGVFIRTIRIPQIGRVLRLPDGRQVPVTGTVVRSYRAPGALRALVPSGFALNFSEMPPPEYDEFASHL